MTRRSPPSRAILFVALGLVAAFTVSVVAMLRDDGSGGSLPTARAISDPSEVRVEVLNGAGTSGLARDATHRLRSGGFDVVYFGNASTFDRGRSVVLDRVGEPARARAVAASLGIDSVASAPDTTLLLDVTVVLGDDWPPPPEKGGGPLERLRGAFGRDDP
jgi:LytR cell envelope-related transcriptional attenuator